MTVRRAATAMLGAGTLPTLGPYNDGFYARAHPAFAASILKSQGIRRPM
jgi:hypothetical protein